MLSLTTPEMINAHQAMRRKEANDFRRTKRLANAQRARRDNRVPKFAHPGYRLVWLVRR